MRKLVAFYNMTLDGYFAGPTGDISWAHTGAEDTEYNAFVADNAKGGGILLLGRVTYQLMIRYWPTPLARQQNPVVAERMNQLSKIVFSRTLREASWSNTTVVKDDILGAVRKMKREADTDMAILGSGSIVSQLAQAGLIDEFQAVVNPVVLGKGRTVFDGVTTTLPLTRTTMRAFANGKVFLCYAPAKKLEIIAEPGTTSIVTRRVVGAPRTLVFDAFTKPEHLMRWLGPRNVPMVSCETDFRVGGRYRFVHRTADGREFGFHGEFREIVPPERIVRTFVFEPVPDHEAIETLLLEERDGKTTITTTTVHKTVEGRDGHLAGGGMEAGMTEGYERLDTLLAELQKS